MTTIKLKNGSGAPTAGDLAQGEPALDLTNKRLYTEDSGGTVIEVGTNPGTDVTFADNRKAIFGAGSDLQIYHDGSNSFIQDSGTGDLIVRASSNLYLQSYSGAENYLTATTNGAVTAYYDNAAKLATTSTGIDVTGTVTADGLSVDGSSSGTLNNVNFLNTNSGATTTANRIGLGITNSAGAAYTYIEANEDGIDAYPHLNFYTGVTATKRLEIEDNGDISFYEDTGTTAKLFWDASAERLGLGTSSPSSVLHLSTSNDPKITLTDTGFGASADITGSNGNLRLNSQTATIFDMADSEVMRIDSSGRVGIGTSPDFPLHVSSTGVVLGLNATSGAVSQRFNENGTARFFLSTLNGSNGLAFVNGDGVSERMRIDSSGNLLVGQTSADSNSVGIGLLANGTAYAVRNGSAAFLAHRKSSDGNIMEFLKDNATVGSIGTAASRVYIGTDDTGLRFTNDEITPFNPSVSADRNGTVDLGGSSTRFKDLYLSGVSYNGDGSASSPSISFGADTNTGFYRVGSDQIGFVTGGSLKAKLDASGNFMVGTTDTLPQTFTSGGGFCYAPNSSLRIARQSDGTGQPTLDLNNSGSDDEIIRFRKDGTTVGSIGSTSSELGIGGGDANLLFMPNDNAIAPSGTSSGGASDGVLDLGRSARRFKDLYLSGTANTGRIKADDGSLGNTGITDCDVQIIRNATSNLGLRTVSNGEVIRFVHTSTDVGSIDITTSATSYNTSSDYRLKENVVAMSGATERLKQLAPKRFNFIADADTTVDGFLAHEVQAVVPEAITGTHNEVDNDGNPIYQGIDQSKLVPLLVATIQELEARIAALESN